jgi:hypothetical protein
VVCRRSFETALSGLELDPTWLRMSTPAPLLVPLTTPIPAATASDDNQRNEQ